MSLHRETWEDRVKVAKYTSAEGNSFVFDWEETEESYEHKTAVFRFPGKDGAEIPSQGVGEHRFPLTAFIYGEQYDTEAQKFMNILAERGNGILIHPIYGRKSVQVVSVKRTDKPLSAGSQAVISILFLESAKIFAQETVEDLEKRIVRKDKDFSITVPAEYEQEIGEATVPDDAKSVSRFKKNLGIMDSILAPIAAIKDDVNTFFKRVNLSLNNNLTNLVGKPLTLASQVMTLIKAPARIAQSIKLQIDGYRELADTLKFTGFGVGTTNDDRNKLLEMRFILGAITATFAEAVLLVSFGTKGEALGAALDLQNFHDENTNFIENEEAKFQDTKLELLLYGDSQGTLFLNQIVELTANILSKKAFDLEQERTITLVRERNIYELSYELYGTSDNEKVDFLIESNRLIGSEIILIPQGREIVYYV